MLVELFPERLQAKCEGALNATPGQGPEVNLLAPGRFTLPVAGGPEIEVKIATGYPASAGATIEVKNVPEDVHVRVRVPECIAGPVLSETRTGDAVRVVLQGTLGHRIEECQGGVMLAYGPLVLAPSTYSWDPPIPAAIGIENQTNGDGFLEFGPTPLPEWSYFEEGPGSRCGATDSFGAFRATVSARAVISASRRGSARTPSP